MLFRLQIGPRYVLLPPIGSVYNTLDKHLRAISQASRFAKTPIVDSGGFAFLFSFLLGLLALAVCQDQCEVEQGCWYNEQRSLIILFSIKMFLHYRAYGN
jgi:hypothetical protein